MKKFILFLLFLFVLLFISFIVKINIDYNKNNKVIHDIEEIIPEPVESLIVDFDLYNMDVNGNDYIGILNIDNYLLPIFFLYSSIFKYVFLSIISCFEVSLGLKYLLFFIFSGMYCWFTILPL